MSKSVETLAAGCLEEQQRRSAEGSDCFVLFRLALLEGVQEAWTALRSLFEDRVTGWVNSYSRFHLAGEEPVYFVNEAFARLWQFGMVAAQRGQFKHVGDYLQYLKRCAWSAIEDHIRSLRRDALWDRVRLDAGVPAGEEEHDRMLVVRELYEIIAELTRDNHKEWVIAEQSWVYGLQPRQIQRAHPDLFPTVAGVNQNKRNLLRRLRRHPRIRQLVKWMD